MDFKPTKSMKVAKAKLWTKLNSNPLLGDPEHMTQDLLRQLMGVKSVNHWMALDGFKEWLIDSSHNSQLLESAIETAIGEAIKLLEIPVTADKDSPRWADKISAIKLVLDYAGFSPKKAAKPDDMADLSEENLDKLIAKQLRQQGLQAQ